MADLTPGQRRLRERTERLVGIAAPFLDLLLGVGERISRIAEPTDHEYYPIQPGMRRALPGELREVEPGEEEDQPRGERAAGQP